MIDPVVQDVNRSGSQLLGLTRPRHKLKIGILVSYACAFRAEAYMIGSNKSRIYADCILQVLIVFGKHRSWNSVLLPMMSIPKSVNLELLELMYLNLD